MDYQKTIWGILVLGCLLASSIAIRAADMHRLALSGRLLSAEELVALEKGVAEDATDADARVRLLGYYFSNQRKSSDYRVARQRHVLWFIKNDPESKVLGSPYGSLSPHSDREVYYSAKKHLESKIEEDPDNLTILDNAAKFFTLPDRKRAIELLERAELLDENNPHWASSLGRMYLLDARGHRETDSDIAKDALMAFKRAYDLSSGAAKDRLLISLSKAAFMSKEYKEAKLYATRLLEGVGASWNSGNQTHHGNVILGCIAFHEGDTESAKTHLLLAGKTSGSPQLNSFGPNMTLAKRLLESGHKDVVIEYFDLCATFWKGKERKLEDWKVLAAGGRIPDFGANLRY